MDIQTVQKEYNRKERELHKNLNIKCQNIFQNKVSNITFYSGPNSDELVKLGNVELETRLLGGWVNCPIPGTYLIA